MRFLSVEFLKFGKIIRRYSIDEIPQFFNVLNGDMSIVGPRPHMVEHDIHYSSLFNNFLKRHKPKYIFIAAAKVGGIYSNNKYRADFIYSNLSIQNNIIHAAYKCNIKDLIFLGSSCVYPKLCKQPIKEDYLLNGKLEKTNEPYAIAKIAGIKMCESYNRQYGTNYKCIMPTNTFGPYDNYDKFGSHFFPALIKKLHEF